MIRKKRVSFRDDLVESIPSSFRPALEASQEVFPIDGIAEVFPFLIQFKEHCKITCNHNVSLFRTNEHSH